MKTLKSSMPGAARLAPAPAPRAPFQAVRSAVARTQSRAQPAQWQQTDRSTSMRVRSSSETAVPVQQASPSTTGVPSSTVWELDFCSRPMLDERGKKVWELLICDPARNWEFSEYFPNSKINSGELRRAIESVLTRPGAVKPDKVRFFRGQMQTIITKALGELDIKAVPSRRCFTLMSWLQQRAETVYPADPRYAANAATMFNLDLGPPEPLPDALRGEKWAFVQLPLGALLEMQGDVTSGETFGAGFTLAQAGAVDVPPEALIPGVAVFSRRALPLAAWTNGLEIAGVKVDVDRSCLILETGVNQRWRYGGWKPSAESIAEAENWEAAKKRVKGIHFLAVQPDPDSDELTGIWLLQDRNDMLI